MIAARQSQPSYPDQQSQEKQRLPVPTEPPFNCFIGNLSFEVTDRDIENLFGELNVSLDNDRSRRFV